MEALPSGLVSVALKIDDGPGSVRYEAAIVSGIVGFKIDESNEIPAVQSVHGWTIFK